MDTVTSLDILSQSPLVRQTPYGWLATTAKGYLPIGVVGQTESEARDRYSDALQAWALLRERQAPPSDYVS
jgi:hypothetical protein